MRAEIMIRLMLVLVGFLASVSGLHLQQASLRGRQTGDLIDPYPCWYCDTNDPINIGPDTCSEARDDESFCTPFDEPSTHLSSGSDHDLNATILSQQAGKGTTWSVDGVDYDIRFSTYPSCSKAADGPSSKWWGFPISSDESTCPLQIRKLEDNAVIKTRFQSDHVFEKQMLLDFFKWLHGEFDLVRWPQGYGYPSTNWIAGRLMGLSPDFYTCFQWDGLCLWDHLVQELGSNYHKERLALVDGKINNIKGKFFRSQRPREFPTAQSTIGAVKAHQRTISGVFQYVRQEEVWRLMTDTSKGIEGVLRTFDVRYAWDDEDLDILSWPDRKEGEGAPGLRDLYCHWIDERLRNIEYNAGVWLQTAKAEFEARVITDPARPDEKQDWLHQYDSGILSQESFQFLRVHQEEENGVFKNSEFSMWSTELGPAGPFPTGA